MSDGEIIETIASIDEQIHDFRKMVLESDNDMRDNNITMIIMKNPEVNA